MYIDEIMAFTGSNLLPVLQTWFLALICFPVTYTNSSKNLFTSPKF